MLEYQEAYGYTDAEVEVILSEASPVVSGLMAPSLENSCEDDVSEAASDLVTAIEDFELSVG